MKKIITIECDYCKKPFEKDEKYVKQAANRGYKLYCSKECQRLSKFTGEELICSQCGKTFYRNKSRIDRSKRTFCSNSCSANFYNKYKIKTNGKSVAHYRKKALSIPENVSCYFCGYSILEILEVHHKDGNRENNLIENLIPLCPTHHKELHRGIITMGL